MRIWINNKLGFLTGYSSEYQEGMICVVVPTDDRIEMLGGLLDFHNYYFDGTKLIRNTNNPVQKMFDNEANKPPEPTKEELAERLEKLERLLADLI